jgi:hypothetical protein
MFYTRALVLCAAVCAVAAPAATADDWFPHPAGAQWTYRWSDATYNPLGTTENVTVDSQPSSNCGWQLKWTGDTQVPLGSSNGGQGGGPLIDSPDNGTMCFEDQDYGLVNTDWSSTPPPINEPPLCPSATQCPNALSGTLYMVIWGSRSPLISEPLLRGTTWTSTGGGDNSVTSENQYIGLERVKVPAFPNGVLAATVQSQIALAGTFGDDFGSGDRTTWWVYGVGPVRVEFDHVDGSVTIAELQSTNLTPLPPRPDEDYFPLTVGQTGTYRWTNSKHLPQPEIETISVVAAANRSARITVKSVSGPLRAAGSYIFTTRLDGLRNTYGFTSAASLATFPPLGHGRHFFNPVDLMTFGFNPVLPAYAVAGTKWSSGNPRDWNVFGVRGTTTVIGVRAVRVPAGSFRALEVRSVLTRSGHPFGSGIRTMWFAPGRGLVKLLFQHRDGSTSLVQLIR